MRAFLIVAAFVLVAGAAHAADDVATCKSRQAELSPQVQAYQGDPMMKRIMQADLERATRELIEGDADECMEALDHATKLLSGKV